MNDENDSHPFDQYQCSDNDVNGTYTGDGCDDCSSGSYDVDNDGADSDADGTCDAGDHCAGGHDDYDGDADGTPDDCDVDHTLHAGANLISFYALPDDASVSSVFADLGDNATGVIGESVVSANFGADGWIGSLTEVSDESGYWLKVTGADELETQGLPTGAVEYSLSVGNNLSSYSYAVGQSLSDALPVSAGKCLIWCSR